VSVKIILARKGLPRSDTVRIGTILTGFFTDIIAMYRMLVSLEVFIQIESRGAQVTTESSNVLSIDMSPA
jgi:hypothetical protein